MSNPLIIKFTTPARVGMHVSCLDPDLKDDHGRPVMTEGTVVRLQRNNAFVVLAEEPGTARRFNIG